MDTERLRSLLTEALSLLDEEPVQKEVESNNDQPVEETLTGKVGRPEFKERKGIALWEAGFKIADGEGHRWIDIQAWRKTAVFARDNLPSATVATAVGKWKHEEWTGNDGVDRERDVFVVTHFKLEVE